MNENIMGLILVFAGLFSIAGAVFDWDWFMTHRKARLLVKLLTRNGARVFYAVLGVIISVIGILVMLNAFKTA
ncbi:MAG: immunity 17 family protein [Candidatus Auribacterota bacterium]